MQKGFSMLSQKGIGNQVNSYNSLPWLICFWQMG